MDTDLLTSGDGDPGSRGRGRRYIELDDKAFEKYGEYDDDTEAWRKGDEMVRRGDAENRMVAGIGDKYVLYLH